MPTSQNEEAHASDDNLSNLARFYKTCYQEAYKAYYEEDNPARCRYICRELLVDPRLPFLYRVTMNLLLGNLQEPEDAGEFIEQALYWLSKMPKQSTDPDKCGVALLEGIAKEGLAKVQAILAKEEEETRLRAEDFMSLAQDEDEDLDSAETTGETRSAFDLMAVGAKRQHLSDRRSTSPIKSRPALEPSTAAARRRSLSPTKADRETLLTSWLHPSTPVSAITFKKPKDDNHGDNGKSPSKKRKAE